MCRTSNLALKIPVLLVASGEKNKKGQNIF